MIGIAELDDRSPWESIQGPITIEGTTIESIQRLMERAKTSRVYNLRSSYEYFGVRNSRFANKNRAFANRFARNDDGRDNRSKRVYYYYF